MTAIETVHAIMGANNISLGELVEYADMGTKSNICQLLSRNDLKVGTFVRLLETMGFQNSNQNEVSQILSSEEVSV